MTSVYIEQVRLQITPSPAAARPDCRVAGLDCCLSSTRLLPWQGLTNGMSQSVFGSCTWNVFKRSCKQAKDPDDLHMCAG